jgi:DNA-binding NarL/FixJ family response regulator
MFIAPPILNFNSTILSMRATTVLLVDDHTIVREGIRLLLHTENDIRVVGEAETGLQAVQLARTLLPDVVVMDIVMPVLDGLEATRRILRDVPATKVLLLSSYSDNEYVRRAVEVGAAGYVLKQGAMSELVKAIRSAGSTNGCAKPGAFRWQPSNIPFTRLESVPTLIRRDDLSPRQIQILRAVAEGRSNKEIAVELAISVKTVEKHRQAVMNRLNLHETAGLTSYAIANRIIRLATRATAAWRSHTGARPPSSTLRIKFPSSAKPHLS